MNKILSNKRSELRVLCITDSLGLPRKTPEEVHFDETWVQILKNDYNVYSLSLGGGRLKDFTKQLEYIKLFQPDIVCVQFGIVDCTPRALTKFENDFINQFWFTKKLARKLLPRYSRLLRKKRGITYTNAKKFDTGILKIQRAFSCRILCIGIIPSNAEYEFIVPGVSGKIIEYNNILKNKFKNDFIDVNKMDIKFVMSDHIHLNERGHGFLAHIVKNKIEEITSKLNFRG